MSEGDPPARPALSSELLKPLYQRSNLRPLVEVLLSVGAVAGLITAVVVYPRWYVFGAAFVLMAGLQHRISILQHEANHYLLFTSRRFNDLIGALCAYSLFFTMRYRKLHNDHHKTLGTSEDPDQHNYREYPLRPGAFLADLAFHLSGLAAVVQFLGLSGKRPSPAPEGPASADSGPDRAILLVLAGHATIAGGLLLYDWRALALYLGLWICPLVTLTKTLTHLRNVVEHTQTRDVGDPELSRYRTIHCGLIERFFFAPLGFNFHAEHHFYPGVPYHNLSKAHLLLAEDPRYPGAVQIAQGYLRFLLKEGIAWGPAPEALESSPSSE